MKKTKHLIHIIIPALVLVVLTAIAWFRTPDEYSDTERRVLAQFPEINTEAVLAGTFSSSFEDYATDQFPFRDAFRQMKVVTTLFLHKEYNDYYRAEGHIGKLEYPKNPDSIDHATALFTSVYDRYLKDSDTKTYFAMIPDKNAYLAAPNGYPSLDYAALRDELSKKLPFFTHLDVSPYLSLEDYYKTDPHWRQESIFDVADYLASSMNASVSDEYQIKTLEKPFVGTYGQQLSLPVDGEPLSYVTYSQSDFTVTHYDSGMPKKAPLYDMDKAEGKDPYDLFLSGAVALLTVENHNVRTDRELIIFRDSFGSSIAPLLASGYQKVTLVDLRYVNSGMLSYFIDFTDQDVLFMYSNTILNSSFALK
ncbi:MAG: hypothetical protein J6D04_02560 [Clostridia bacterium]|nr:hypothetical protein [Clostridia bacterium]